MTGESARYGASNPRVLWFSGLRDLLGFLVPLRQDGERLCISSGAIDRGTD